MSREALDFTKQIPMLDVEGTVNLAAQAMVMSKLLEVTLPRLTSAQCIEVEEAFRESIDDAMLYVNDVSMSALYHCALWELANLYLAALHVKCNCMSGSTGKPDLAENGRNDHEPSFVSEQEGLYPECSS